MLPESMRKANSGAYVSWFLELIVEILGQDYKYTRKLLDTLSEYFSSTRARRLEERKQALRLYITQNYRTPLIGGELLESS